MHRTFSLPLQRTAAGTVISPDNKSDGNDKFKDLYTKPYCRVCTYAIGLSVGWVIFSYRKFKETNEVFDSWALAVANVVTSSQVFRCAMFVIGVGLLNFILFI